MKSLITALLVILVMSPEASAAVASRLVSFGVGLGLRDAAPLGDELGEADPDGEGLGEALPDAFAWPAPPSACAPAACPLPPEADGDGLGEADPPGDGDEVGDGLAVGGCVVVPVPGGGRAMGLPGAASSTWRNLRTAELSSGEICSALLPGTDTTIRSEPCCCTFAPVKPWPLTRLFRIAMD